MHPFLMMYKCFFGMMLIGIALWNWLDWIHDTGPWWNDPVQPALLFFVSMAFGFLYSEIRGARKPDRL